MPDFAAIIYFFLGLKRTPLDDNMLAHILQMKSSNEIMSLLPEGLKMNQPIPIFSPVEDVEAYRQQFK